MLKRTLVPLFLSCVLALAAHGGQTWHVAAGATPNGDGSSAHPFATLQAAAIASGSGDVILVQPGTYSEYIDLNQGKTLRSVGGPEVTTIAGVRAFPAFIEGFSMYAGVQLWWGSKMKRCIVRFPGDRGVIADDFAEIDHCVITNCATAIWVFGNTWIPVQVTNSIFYDIAASWDAYVASRVVATRCCIPPNVLPPGPGSSENITADPLFFDVAHGDYHLAADSPCIPFDIGVYPFEAAYPTYATEFCLGDGSSTACPCSNESATAEGAGCRNSTGVAATLRASGRASVSLPSVILRGASMPDGPVLYFQGSALSSAFPFGNGIKCTGGALIRLGIRFNVDGTSTFPDASQSLPIAGLISAPGARMYQARYRDIMNSCSSENFNYTNGLRIDWHF